MAALFAIIESMMTAVALIAMLTMGRVIFRTEIITFFVFFIDVVFL